MAFATTQKFVREHLFELLITGLVSFGGVLGTYLLSEIKGNIDQLQCRMSEFAAKGEFNSVQLKLIITPLDDVKRNSDFLQGLAQIISGYRKPLGLCPEGAEMLAQVVNYKYGLDAWASRISRSSVSTVVFVCIDRGDAKRPVIERLVANGTPFVDVGMGVVLDEGRLAGIIRLTTSTPDNRDSAAVHISYADEDDEENEYTSSIQIAELNALNAVMAVMRWKRQFGIYADRRKDWYAGYSIPSGEIIMEGPTA
jgi:hypothetical protein